MSFSTRLKLARQMSNLSREELANLLGVSKSAISNYENGISHPKEEILFAIFDVLKVEPNFLFVDYFIQSAQNSLSDTEQTLIDKYRQLNDDGQEYINEQIDFALSKPDYKKHNQFKKLDKKA